MKVLKFGGSSVGSADRFHAVASIVIEAKKSAHIVVVVSAVGGVTNQLISASQEASRARRSYEEQFRKLSELHIGMAAALLPPQRQTAALLAMKLLLNELEDVLKGIFLIKELSKRTLDYVMSFGERLSALLLAETLNARGLKSEVCDSRLLVITDANFGNAHVDHDVTYSNIRRHFAEHRDLQVVTGFIGSTPTGETTTLGRGGSDLTASIAGAALSVDEVEIWTDVDGIMTADPRKVTESFSLPGVTYEEAMELSHFGAKVIYPPTMQPAMDKGIPLRVKNSFNPEFPGTVIGSRIDTHPHTLTGISSIRSVALLQVRGSGMIGVAGISARLFGALARHQISVVLITQASSEHTICFAVNPQDASSAKAVIEDEFRAEFALHLIKAVDVEHDLSIVSVVGENMRKTPGVAGMVFSSLGRNGINVVAIAQGSSERNISVVINREDEAKALNALHQRFFLSDRTTLHLFLVGTGLIGTTLLTQIKEQKRRLLREHGLEIKLIGLSNSKTMFFDEDGINYQQWTLALAASQRQANIDQFIDEMKRLNLPNSVFVDCTASAAVAAQYGRILDSSVAVVTPNKKAQSGAKKQFDEARAAARKRGVGFLYEASVGAGLPVIQTLRDLVVSGDTVDGVEAVLSGTLSYIFNTFDGREPFSEVVRDAMKRGLTEPDPREDLSGRDVARKILTLAREMDLSMELDDVVLESLVPERCAQASSVAQFFERLKEYDEAFEVKRAQAAEHGAVLRFIAALREGRAVVALREVDLGHPFAALRGSDNMIVFRTKRYHERPLVVQGPGAGAEVTAACVFADIVRVSNSIQQRL